MMRAEMDVPFKGGTVRVNGSSGGVFVRLLDRDYDGCDTVHTDSPGDLRELAKALNMVADFIEGAGG